MNDQISAHANDVIQKYTANLFKDQSLAFLGIKETARVKGLISVELPVVEVSTNTMDFVFVLENGKYIHLEFQTTYNKKDLLRFALYDLRLYERDQREITTVIVYTADVKRADKKIKIGSLKYKPVSVMMADRDGQEILSKVENKLENGIEPDDGDILNMIFAPLMKNEMPRLNLAIKTVALAQKIQDKTKRDTCTAAAYAFASKYLNDDDNRRLLKEVLEMSDLLKEELEKAHEKGIEQGIEQGIELEKKQIAVNMLKNKSFTIDDVMQVTGLSRDAVEKLKKEI